MCSRMCGVLFRSSFTVSPHLEQSAWPSRSAALSFDALHMKHAFPEGSVRLSVSFCQVKKSWNDDDNVPEYWYGKSSVCLTMGMFFWSCGLSSWKRMHDRVTRNVLLKRNVGLPGFWTETEGLMGCMSWPGTLLHDTSIFSDQHQSCTCVGPSLSVAGMRQRIWESTLAIGSASRWAGRLSRSLNANWIWQTCVMANTIRPSHLTKRATGLPTWREGVPKGLSLDVIMSVLAILFATSKQGSCCTHLRWSVEGWLAWSAIWCCRALALVVFLPWMWISEVLLLQGSSSAITSSRSPSCVYGIEGSIKSSSPGSWFDTSNTSFLSLGSSVSCCWLTRRVPKGDNMSIPVSAPNAAFMSGMSSMACLHPRSQQVCRFTFNTETLPHQSLGFMWLAVTSQ